MCCHVGPTESFSFSHRTSYCSLLGSAREGEGFFAASTASELELELVALCSVQTRTKAAGPGSLRFALVLRFF
jgi:hypothetical protein